MSRIVVCDDDKEIVDAITIYLEQEGYEVVAAYNGKEAVDIVKNQDVDLLIIDVMMPELGGIEATFQIREVSNIPIIILSAKSEDQDKIFGLKVGADDYVTKPFNPMELVARVQSQLRRSRMQSIPDAKSTAGQSAKSVYRTGGLVIDDEKKVITVDGEKIRFTPIEYNILLLFARNMGRTFSSEEIYERIWDEPAYGEENVVAVHIRHIREKIEINPKQPKYLLVEWGIGYRLEKID